jgi:hypothetical protein
VRSSLTVLGDLFGSKGLGESVRRANKLNLKSKDIRTQAEIAELRTLGTKELFAK